MAALVRAANFCRALPSLVSLVRQQSSFPSFGSQSCPTIISRSLNSQAEAAQEVAKFSQKSISSINRKMITVETNIHRYGRVSQSQLNALLQEIDKRGQVSSAQALLALRAMGSTLFDEHPSARIQLADTTWEKFEKLGLEFDVTHYNAILKTYLQNKHPFSPSTFLETMETKQIQPNRVTYQNLISQYCENGDIAGASQILEYMKKLELPIGEQVFNSLITGHFRANDPENAEGILDIMRKAGMEPGADTYLTLLMGYIENGQIEKLDNIMEMVENESVMIRPIHLLKIIYELAIHKQMEAIPKFLDKLSSFSGINQDAIIWINQLICQGHEDVAYQIFSIMPKPVNKDFSSLTLGRFFIRAMVKNERPVDLVCHYMKKMRDEGFNKDDINFPTHMAYLYEKTDYALELIQKMESEGLPVRIHYFWPALCQYSNLGNKEAYVKTVKMLQNLISQEEGMVLTFHEYIIPGLIKLGYTYDEGFQTLTEIGFSPHEVNFAYFINLLETKDLATAVEFANGKSMMIIVAALRPYLIKKYKETNDWKSVIQILHLSSTLLAPKTMLADLAGDWLALVFQTKRWDVIQDVIEEMIAEKINITSQFYQQMSKSEIPQDIQQKLDMLLEDSKEVSINRFPVSEMTTSELADLVQTTGNKTAKKWLLIRYCAVGNVDEAEKLKASLDAEGFLYPPIVLRQLLFMNTLYKKDEQQAMEYLNLLQNQYPEYNDYTRALLMMATLMTNNGKVSDAIGLLETYAKNHEAYMKEQNYNKSYTLEGDCSLLIKSVVKNEDPAVAKQVLQLLFQAGYIKPATYELIETMMKGYIERNEIDHCMELLDWFITEYKRAPCIDGLLQMLIKSEDPEKLQKVMDLVTPIHGEMNLLHQLMINLVECGHLKKARKILETPGLRAAMIRLRIGCENLINQNKITELEQLVEITKGMFALDRDEMLFQLIRGYVKLGDFKKAEDVLIQYEEEDFSPSGRTLRYLGKAMKGAGLEISFDVPTVYDEKFNSMLNAEDEILRQVQENRFRTAKDMIRKLEANGPCNSDLLMKIAEFLCKMNKHNDVGWVMQLLADHGDVESLLLLRAKNIISHADILNKCLFTAYVNSNRSEELLTHLNENLNSVGSYISVRGLTKLFQSQPDQLVKIEELAEKCSAQNQRGILWPLWQTLFFANPQCSTATVILQKHPEMLHHMSILGLCQKSVRENKMEVLIEMESLFQHKKETLAFVKSHIIQLHAKNNDLESCLSAIEKLKDVDLNETNLTKAAITDVEKLMKLNNKPLPWKTEAAAAVDSSSSSSSSSDNLDEKIEIKDKIQ